MTSKKVTLPNIQKDYAAFASVYERKWAAFLNETREWVLNHYPENIPQDTKILDLGCGTGEMLSQIYNHHSQAILTGIDGTEEMLALARKKLQQATFYKKNIEDLGSLKEKFDIVMSLNVLHHLSDPTQHIANLDRLCTKDGTVFLCDFAIDTVGMKIAELYWQFFHPAHNRSFPSKKLESLLQQNTALKITHKDILKPDRFWRLQIYKLQKI